ncbi:ABC transporter ATP-binding protein [Clostridiaceae bacterium 35-E11]
MTKAIEIIDLYFKYKTQGEFLLKGIDLSVEKGDVLTIVGLSGNGKSTLCYAMCGIIPHIYKGQLTGEVRIDGKSISCMKIPEIATKVGIVFQDPDTQLFSPTVEDEIGFGPENLCVPRAEIGQRIERVLKQIDMEAYRYENPNNLSGGQKQLIALGAVLSLEPHILIFDEAMAQIDAQGKQQIKRVIRDLKNRGKTIIMIEHDFNNLDVADRVMLLRDGKLEKFEGEL